MLSTLNHWGRVTHICVGKLTIIGSDSGLSPGRRQAIIWTSAGIVLIGPLGTNFSDILIEIITFSFKKMRLKVSSAKWRSCCLGLNVLRNHMTSIHMASKAVGDITCPFENFNGFIVDVWELITDFFQKFWWVLLLFLVGIQVNPYD